MLKKLLVGVSVLTLLLAGCMSHEYADKIDKAVKLQEKKQQKIAKNDSGDEVKHFDKKDANIQTVNGAIVNALRPFLYESTEREPIIIPMILTPDDEN